MLSSFRSSSVMPRRDGHDKYYGDSFTEADANNANGDGLTVKLSYNFLMFLGHLLDIMYVLILYVCFVLSTFQTSFGFLTKEQLMEKFKQCDVNNVRQLSRAELKKRFQYFNKGELNKLVEHAPKLGFTVEP